MKLSWVQVLFTRCLDSVCNLSFLAITDMFWDCLESTLMCRVLKTSILEQKSNVKILWYKNYTSHQSQWAVWESEWKLLWSCSCYYACAYVPIIEQLWLLCIWEHVRGRACGLFFPFLAAILKLNVYHNMHDHPWSNR